MNKKIIADAKKELDIHIATYQAVVDSVQGNCLHKEVLQRPPFQPDFYSCNGTARVCVNCHLEEDGLPQCEGGYDKLADAPERLVSPVNYEEFKRHILPKI